MTRLSLRLLCHSPPPALRRWGWVIAVVCVSVCLERSGWAQDKGRIEGIVRQRDKAIAEHRIMLIRFGPGQQDVNRTPGQTDAEGRFAFDDLETGSDFTYVVGIRYEGQLYRGESISLEPGQTRDDVVLQVGAAGDRATEGGAPPTQTSVHIGQHIMAIVLRDDHVEVREILGIRHPGSEPYEGLVSPSGKSPYVLHLPLPQGYANLRGLQGLDSQHIRSDASGLYYTAPLAPGTHRLLYTYALPMPGNLTTLMTRHTLPTQVFDIFVEAQHLTATSELSFMGRVPIESHTFLHFRSENLEPSARHWLQLTRLTSGATGILRTSSYVLIIGMALLGIAIPIVGVWKNRTPSAPPQPATPDQLQQWQAERTQLLQTIAQLDDAREAGTLDARQYRQQRQAYKRQLLDIAYQLRSADANRREPSVTVQKSSG